MEWIYLLLAGLSEVVWAIGLKYTEGFTKLYASIVTILAMIFSFWFLSLSLKALPMGTAYAVWTGIGTLGTAILGVILFSEPVNAIRIASFLFILLGIIGLKVFA